MPTDERSVHDPSEETTGLRSTNDHPRRDQRGDDIDVRRVPLVATGSSHPGEPGYDGDVTVADEGAAAGPESFHQPFDHPDSESLRADSVPQHTREAWARAEDA